MAGRKSGRSVFKEGLVPCGLLTPCALEAAGSRGRSPHQVQPDSLLEHHLRWTTSTTVGKRQHAVPRDEIPSRMRKPMTSGTSRLAHSTIEHDGIGAAKCRPMR